MKAIQVTQSRYINESYITSFEYHPPTTKKEFYIDSEDHGLQKMRDVPVESSIVLVLVNGERFPFIGAEADAIFAKLNEG